MKNPLKKQLFLNLPYLLVFYVGNKVSWLFRRIQLKNIGEKVLYVMNHMEFAFQPPFPSIYWKDIVIGMIAAVIFKGIVYMRGMDKKKYRRGVEYGSARWSA